MRQVKLYDWDSKFDFGQHKGETIRIIFEKSPSYINWCFQKVSWFCITDEIFNQLPIVLSLKVNNTLENVKVQKDWLKILTDIHLNKMEELNNNNKSYANDEEEDFDYYEEDPYMLGDPRYDRNENPWIEVFGEGDEAETAYWNTN